MHRIAPYRALAALTLAGFMLVAVGGDVASRAHAAKKLPPIAEPMYLSAFASIITGRPDDAVGPLSHLASVDPTMADVHNALALAIFAARPDQHHRAFVHAMRALARDLGQILVTIEASQSNPDFPYLLPGYTTLVANPRLAFTQLN